MPVPASTTSAPPASMVSATARAISVWPPRGRKLSAAPARAPWGANASRTASCSWVTPGGRRKRGKAGSSRFLGVERQLQAGDLVAQVQPALLQPAQQEFVEGCRMRSGVDEGVQVPVLDPQLDQPPLGR